MWAVNYSVIQWCLGALRDAWDNAVFRAAIGKNLNEALTLTIKVIIVSQAKRLAHCGASCCFAAMHNLLTVKETAKYLRIPLPTVYYLVQRGQLPAIQIGGRWRIKKASLDKDILKEDKSGQPTVLWWTTTKVSRACSRFSSKRSVSAASLLAR